MSARYGSAAQMSTYPLDVKHVEHLLAHHIRVWGGMVDRIVVTIDTHQSRTGRYRGTDFEQSLARLRKIVSEAREHCPILDVFDVDYSDSARNAVARYFFDTDNIPIKAWDGGPYYAYFYGLYAANARYVMHFDGDMMFGGGSRRWIEESIACLERNPDVLFTAPFPGPPRADGRLFGHAEADARATSDGSMPFPIVPHRDVSTRAFMIDLQRFKERLGHFPTLRPGAVQRMKAKLLGNPPLAREAEVMLSQTMQREGLRRIDLLGSAPGLWSLHPPYRSEEFYGRLPELIRAVEADDVPDGQRGHYDMNDSMIDWTQARAQNHWRRRYLRMIRHRLA